MNFDSYDLLDEVRLERGSYAPTDYAGYSSRLIAFIIDAVLAVVLCILIYFAFSALALILTLIGGSGNGGMGSAATPCMCLDSMVMLIAVWLFYAGFESSWLMATPGKLLAGAMVTDLAGNRISFGQATLRFLCLNLLWLGGLGTLYYFVSDKKQALHDVFAGTLVLNRD